MTLLLLRLMALIYLAGFIMLFSRELRLGVDEIIPLLGVVYCLIALAVLRSRALYRTALKGLALFVFARCALVWGFGDLDQVMITTLVLILVLPVLLACGLMLGWSTRKSYMLVGMIGLTSFVLSIVRSGEIYDFGAPPGLFAVALVISFSLLVSFLDRWRSSQIELARKQKEVTKLSHLAMRDPLTEIPNRRAGGDMLFVQLAAGAKMTIAFIDLDHFKLVNDEGGHAEGDRVLKRIATKLKQELREADQLIRWGGDEFLVIMSDISEADAQQIAERIRKAIENCNEPPFDKITTSIGLTTAAPGDNVRSLLNRADAAVYRAKESGRNRVVTLNK